MPFQAQMNCRQKSGSSTRCLESFFKTLSGRRQVCLNNKNIAKANRRKKPFRIKAFEQIFLDSRSNFNQVLRLRFLLAQHRRTNPSMTIVLFNHEHMMKKVVSISWQHIRRPTLTRNDKLFELGALATAPPLQPP